MICRYPTGWHLADPYELLEAGQRMAVAMGAGSAVIVTADERGRQS